MKYVPGQDTKKSLGQHWLKDKSILEAIVDAANVSDGDEVLEIGPGLGTLTDVLVKRNANVLALEFDRDLINKLTNKYSNCDNIAIIEGDVRTFDYTKMPTNYKIVANIPYYLTSNLIRSISESSNSPSISVLLIQKEVAERICAEPGKMGILSITAQFYFKCSLGVEVPAEYFSPPPKVDSQVVILEKRKNNLFNVEPAKFFKLAKAGFSEKRKTLRNSLSGGLGIGKEEVEQLLNKSSVDLNARAQELSLQEWYELYLMYYGS
jgi:16S rRNA (adenine1518-N6/adenine1519-N6)-dimethyltransferase